MEDRADNEVDRVYNLARAHGGIGPRQANPGVMVNHEQVNVMLEKLKERRGLVLKVKAALRAIGYDPTYWTRVVMYQECFKLVEDLKAAELDVLEIGSGDHWRSRFAFKSYTPFDYPT